MSHIPCVLIPQWNLRIVIHGSFPRYLPKQVILRASCTAPHHILRIHRIPTTDRCGPSRMAIVAGRIRYYVLSCQFVATRSITHTLCSDPAVELTNHWYALLSFYFQTKLCFASCKASHHTLPLRCTPARACCEPLTWHTVAGKICYHILYVVSICHHSLSPLSFVSSPYGTYKSNRHCPYPLYCPLRAMVSHQTSQVFLSFSQ